MPDEPLFQLPDHIRLDLAEAGDVLGALDEAVELAEPGTEVHREMLRVTRLITRKLWPELGDLLDDDDR